ncbi:MAG: phospholipase D-like domain-containing protein, partial [Spirochaetales bacterium]|nr:phospholipase D-like domain-containing protein [Spirochaetales bacterium]
YLQDETGGIAAYGEAGSSLQPGDSVTISGTVKDYRNLLEIDPVTSVTVHSSGNTLPAPKILTAGQIGEEYEGQLVQINSVEFVNPTGSFEGDANYDLTDGENTFEIRINRNAEAIIDEQIPSGTLNLIGLCSQFSYNQNDVTTGYQLLPRNMDDFILTSAINIISPVTVKNISKSGFTLSWRTDAEATPEVMYGTTPNSNDWRDITTGTKTTSNGEFIQEVIISGREAGSVIYAQPYSYASADTAFASMATYATESNSTADMKNYFNSEVDTTYSVYTPAQDIGGALDDTLVAYIDRAEESIDIAIYSFYNISSASVPNALNRAKNRGLQVRIIACGTNQNSGLDYLNGDIPVLVAPDENNRDGIMHNKFAVIDAESSNPDKPMVWTGSTNISYNQIVADANNMIFIQDQALARAYKIEFEEMWGSQTEQPNEEFSRFGAEKTDNTPHEFIMGGNRVECYFSPSDGTNQQLVNAIHSADNNLNVGTMLITRTDLAQAISDAKARGVATNVLTEGDANTETVNSILSDELGSGSYVFDNVTYGILHHKYAVIDNNKSAFDPLVITGSHNWSNSANEINDENTLIIHNEDIANQYYQNFAARFKANNGMLATPASTVENQQETYLYPNPAWNKIKVVASEKISGIKIYNLSGIKIMETEKGNSNTFDVNISDLNPGLYFLIVNVNSGKESSHKISVIK